MLRQDLRPRNHLLIHEQQATAATIKHNLYLHTHSRPTLATTPSTAHIFSLEYPNNIHCSLGRVLNLAFNSFHAFLNQRIMWQTTIHIGVSCALDFPLYTHTQTLYTYHTDIYTFCYVLNVKLFGYWWHWTVGRTVWWRAAALVNFI